VASNDQPTPESLCSSGGGALTDLGPVLLGAPAKDYSIPISVAICFPSEYHQGGTAPRSVSGLS